MTHSVKGKIYGYWVRERELRVVKPQLEQSELNHIGTFKLWIFKIQRSLKLKITTAMSQVCLHTLFLTILRKEIRFFPLLFLVEFRIAL